MLIIFLPLSILIHESARSGRPIGGVLTFIGGGLVFGVDRFFRRPREFYAGQSLSDLKWDLLFDLKKGARMIYLPAWICGILWMISGLIYALIELIKGWSSP
jgi:hypothetical protein